MREAQTVLLSVYGSRNKSVIDSAGSEKEARQRFGQQGKKKEKKRNLYIL